MRDPRTGRVLEVGTDTTRSVSPNLIFKKAPVKAELAVEMLMPQAGRKMRAFWGRDADGEWRGKAEDIGQGQEVSPYTFIRVLDDQEVHLRDVAEITGAMADGYTAAVERDHQDYEDSDYYDRLSGRLQELLENARVMRRDFEAGMKLYFGEEWRDVARKLFPKGRPGI